MKDESLVPDHAHVMKADVLGLAVSAAQQEAEIKNAAKRQAERQAKFDAWIDPEAMTSRRILNDLKAFKSLLAIKDAGGMALPVPLPSDDQLPKHMRGQQPSTVRAWMARHPDWKDWCTDFKKKYDKQDKDRVNHKLKYPELFGLDDAEARAEWLPPETKEVTRVPFRIKEIAPPEPAPKVEEYKPGLVTRIFAGLWKK